MSSQTQKTKQLRVVLIVGGILLLLFLLRGPVRSGLASAYANLFFKSSVAAQFQETFGSVNTELSGLGFTFAEAKPSDTYGCHRPLYSGVGMSVFCLKSRSSDTRAFTPEFVQNWKEKSPAFEEYLRTHGWQKDWDKDQSIADIYDNPDKGVSAGVNYSRKYGDISCELSVVYFASAPDVQKTAVHEHCSRIVKIFGGVGYIARGSIPW